MITDFYEYGWGQSFHFAPRNRGESFDVRACGGAAACAPKLRHACATCYAGR